MEIERPSSFSSFSSFELLPRELRLEVWEIAASKPRVIPVCNPHRRHFIPTLFHTCRESRQVVLGRNYRPSVIVQRAEDQTEADCIGRLYNVQICQAITFLKPYPTLLNSVLAFSFGVVDGFLRRGNWAAANHCVVWATRLYDGIDRVDEEMRLWNLLFIFSLQEGYCQKVIYCARSIAIRHRYVEETIELWEFVLEFCRRERNANGVGYCTSTIKETRAMFRIRQGHGFDHTSHSTQ